MNLRKTWIDFIEFISLRKCMVLFGLIILLCIYLVRIVNIDVGIDTVVSMEYNMNMNHLQIGRWARVFLMKIWAIKQFNPYICNVMSIAFLLFSNFIWLYIFNKIIKNTSLLSEILFTTIYLSSIVWIEKIYFQTDNVENMFAIVLCPFLVYYVYKIDKLNILNFLVSILLLIFLIGIYHANLFLYVAGIICISYGKTIEKDKGNDLNKFILHAILIFACAIIFHKIFDIIIIKILDIKKDNYLENMFIGKKSDLLKIIVKNFIVVIYSTLGKIPFIKSLLDQLVIRFEKMGIEAIKSFSVYANLFSISDVIFLITYIVLNFKLFIKEKNIIIKIVLISVPAFIFSTFVIGTIPIRGLYQIPLLTAFIAYICFDKIRNLKKISIAFILLFIVSNARHIQIGSQLNYSDHLRYENDKRISNYLYNEFYNLVLDDKNENDYFVYIYGSPDYTYLKNYIIGDALGRSVFDCHENGVESLQATNYGHAFLQHLGYNFKNLNYVEDNNFIKNLYYESKNMPSYPKKGCVKLVDNCVILKLSN